MARITIKNIGPIKDIAFDLNKINVFMGPQNCGKSTLAKVISFCYWVEKNCCLLRNENGKIDFNFGSQLESYYNLQGYLNETSFIEYDSDFIIIKYNGKNNRTRVADIKLKKENQLKYKRTKILYIPAERNIISTIPNWFSIKLPNGYLQDFMAEWGEIRNIYNREQPLNIVPLELQYYYNDKTNEDYISVANEEIKAKRKFISLFNSSSGIQSSLPLYLLYKAYYQDKERLTTKNSVEDTITLDNVYQTYLRYPTTVRYPAETPEHDYFDYKGRYYVVAPGEKEHSIEILKNFTETQYIQGVIEEPELNLFPETQRSLVYDLIHDIIFNENQLTITTHSPYILFALNNCMMGGLVGKKIPPERKVDIQSHNSWINPQLVSIYEIHNGELRSIQDEDGILEDNYLNQVYKRNSAEYLSLLNYYDDEK